MSSTTPEGPRVVSASREVAADAAALVDLVADPAQQPRWDGDDDLAQTEPGQRVTAATQGNVREDHVVELVEGRRIACCPASEGEPPAGHLWRWELEPLGPSLTRVTHTDDWTQLTEERRLPRARATGPARLRASVDRLAALAERG